MSKIDPQGLALWKPTPQELPNAWSNLTYRLLEELRGTPHHQFILYAKYDGYAVGKLLHKWGLDWQLVIAGYLWECDQQVRETKLDGHEQVLRHIRDAVSYVRYIEDENLPVLLTPPYRNLGALLIAVAIYYTVFQTLLQMRQDRPSANKVIMQLGKIERIRDTLLSITKRLGLWDLKREVEDLSAELLNPEQFAFDKAEYTRILAQDTLVVEQLCQRFTTYYQQASPFPVYVSYAPCGITGLRRREQDAHTVTTLKLTGFDLVTFDIIVPMVRDCYEALGLISQLGYIQDRVTDHIANPKANGYSYLAFGLDINITHPSIQDTFFAELRMLACQIEIGTPLMQAIMRHGCLHPRCFPLYERQQKSGDYVIPLSLTYWQTEEGKMLSAIQHEIMRGYTLKENESAQKPIIVYDHNRQPISLPRGATALDFAYMTNRSIMSQAVEAFINNRKAPLYRILDTGDVVEIRITPDSHSNLDWLREEYAKTPAAKQHIKSLREKRITEHPGYAKIEEIIKRYRYYTGQQELVAELGKFVLRHKLGTADEYLRKLEHTNDLPYTPEWAAQHIIQQIDERRNFSSTYRWFPMEDVPDLYGSLPLRLCGRCQPDYPQKVLGILHPRKKYIQVHSVECSHIAREEKEQHISIPVSWRNMLVFQVEFMVQTKDRHGLVNDITQELLHYQCTLLSINGDAIEKFKKAEVHFIIETHNYREVINIWDALGRMKDCTVDIDRRGTSSHVFEELQKMRQTYPEHEQAPRIAEPMEPRSRKLINEFDISRPASGKMFFGRDTEIHLIARILCEDNSGRAVILVGPRRSGKTSLCKRILERHIPTHFWSVYYSLQGATRQNEATILENIAQEIRFALQQQLQQTVPAWHEYSERDPQMRFKRFLQECLYLLPDSRLILALDELGGALTAHNSDILEERFFPYWRTLMNEISQLSLILILPTSEYKTLNSDFLANAFTFALPRELSFLDPTSAERLLAVPLGEQHIAVHPNVIRQVFALTSGNPYFLNLLGMQLVHLLDAQPQKQVVDEDDLQQALNQIIWENTGNYFYFYRLEVQDGLEKRILQAIVDMTRHTSSQIVSFRRLAAYLGEPLAQLRSRLDRLRDGLIVEVFDATSSNPRYAFKIDLVRQWMMQHNDFFVSHEDEAQ